MDLDDAAVDHGVFEIGIFNQGSKHPIEGIGLYPPSEPLEHRTLRAERIGEIAPRTTGSNDPEHRLNKSRGSDPMQPASHSRPKLCWAMIAHRLSVNIMQIKVASYLATLEHPADPLDIFKHQCVLG
ncbi:hypothetical protein [Paracoccus actinidiae]|uniref:hypothetical protein n=1 Tax=Paracoccus actinidiae TaxID=3064531 RepID=UPI0027D1ED81|nr:hypothetical protein [Paracoccus sp. M09]